MLTNPDIIVSQTINFVDITTGELSSTQDIKTGTVLQWLCALSRTLTVLDIEHNASLRYARLHAVDSRGQTYEFAIDKEEINRHSDRLFDRSVGLAR